LLLQTTAKRKEGQAMSQLFCEPFFSLLKFFFRLKHESLMTTRTCWFRGFPLERRLVAVRQSGGPPPVAEPAEPVGRWWGAKDANSRCRRRPVFQQWHRAVPSAAARLPGRPPSPTAAAFVPLLSIIQHTVFSPISSGHPQI
jgi:hypothetical protein